MRLLAFTSRAIAGIADGTLRFGPGLNVVLAHDDACQTFRNVVSSLARGRSPFDPPASVRPRERTPGGEVPRAEMDVELRDGSRVRLSGALGQPFRAYGVPSGDDCTDVYVAGGYGFVAPLDDRERAELASMRALLGEEQLDRLRGLEARVRTRRWWDAIGGPQIILCGAVGIAIGAFVWPASHVAAIAAGVVVAAAVAAFLVWYSARQLALDLQAALLRLGVRSPDQLEQRLEELEGLQRRRALQEAWEQAWGERKREMPEPASVAAEPLVVGTEPQAIPVFLFGDTAGGRRLAVPQAASTGDLAQRAQIFMFAAPLEEADRQAYSGPHRTLISLDG